MYGIIIPAIREKKSVYPELDAMSAEEAGEADGEASFEEWETKNRREDWLRNKLKDIYSNACNRACGTGTDIPAGYSARDFVHSKLRKELRTSFWHFYLEEWRVLYPDFRVSKSESLCKSRLDQMMRVLNQSSTQKWLHDIESWEHAIAELNQGWKDFFRTSVFPVIGVSASGREPETVPRCTERKRQRGKASSVDTDEAKERSIFEIDGEEERQTFLRDFRGVQVKMQDPIEEDGEPLINVEHPSVICLGDLSEQSEGKIQAFHRAMSNTKPRAVRFDASQILTPQKQASFVKLVEMEGLHDYRSKDSKFPFPEGKLRLTPIWSRLLLKRVDSSTDFFKYVSKTEYDMCRLHATGQALQDLVTTRSDISPLVQEIFETGSNIYRKMHMFVAAGDPIMKGVDTNLLASGLSILCSRNLPEQDAVQVEKLCGWCLGRGQKKAGGGGGGAEQEEEGDGVGAAAAEAGGGGRVVPAEGSGGGGAAAAAEGGGGGGAAAAEGGGGGAAAAAEGSGGAARRPRRAPPPRRVAQQAPPPAGGGRREREEKRKFLLYQWVEQQNSDKRRKTYGQSPHMDVRDALGWSLIVALDRPQYIDVWLDSAPGIELMRDELVPLYDTAVEYYKRELHHLWKLWNEDGTMEEGVATYWSYIVDRMFRRRGVPLFWRRSRLLLNPGHGVALYNHMLHAGSEHEGEAVYRVHMYMTESGKLIADEVAGAPVSDLVYDFRTDERYFPLARYLRTKPSKTVNMTQA
jgi:hypothetical protein